MILRLPLGLRAYLVDRAIGAYPREACGFLLGHIDLDRNELSVTLTTEVENVSPSAHRFVMHPAAGAAVVTAAELHRCAILGVWHTHPCSPAEPSESDLEHCHWPLAIIANPGGEVRAWARDAELRPVWVA